MEETIHIYHTNDLHSHFDYWPRIGRFLDTRKKWHLSEGDEVIVMDIGDHIDRVHPLTEGTYGKANTSLLNKAGYQYAAIGNNEGITLPHDKLDELYDEASFTVLAANIFYEDGRRPNWALPSCIHQTRKGSRIGLIGVTAFYERYYELLGWKITDPIEAIQKELAVLAGKTDMIVLLSHLGLHEDEKIAGQFPGIDVILGAHTHHVLHEGRMAGNTLVCGAGKFGYYVGHVEIHLDKEGMRKRARVYETHTLDESPSDAEYAGRLFEIGKDSLSSVEADVPFNLTCDWFMPSDLPRLLCEGLREWCKADCAFLNAGLVLDSLPAGGVSRFDLHRICPHPINPCLVELNGEILREILIQSRAEEWPEMQIMGLGFRGKVMGNMVYDKISFLGEDIFIDGQVLQNSSVYRLAIPDMFTFGRFFPVLRDLKDKTYLMPEFLRDILLEKIKGL
ncbi:bifunctional metallophosphatase/5'-nucleotidase [Peribacillus sp. SCS-26]|uniref:bifunctional metallophosphatase/5'-nucleotidase n=1 Tax=Paraperibacillus marinus TaxID=3115295 RepID=UPI00390654EE